MEFNFFKAVIQKCENKEFLFPTLRICQIVSGEFAWQIGKNTISVNSGDIVLLNNLIPRKIINTKALTIELNIFEFSPAYIFDRRLLPEIFYSENPVSVTTKSRKAIGSLLGVLAESYETVPVPAFFGHIFQAVFDLLENDAGDYAGSRKHSAMVHQAVEYIWGHYCEDISVPDVARNLNISKNHLEKMFIDMLGIGVAAYIRMIRVYKVMALLKEDKERSVLDIAFACGFNSSSGFYKAYKAVIGQRPRRINGA